VNSFRLRRIKDERRTMTATWYLKYSELGVEFDEIILAPIKYFWCVVVA
jgi:hypothetical protein